MCTLFTLLERIIIVYYIYIFANVDLWLDVSDDKVNRITGFSRKDALLDFISIVYDGDVEKMAERVTEMTLFEERLSYF